MEKEVGSGGRKRRRKAGEGRKMEKKRGGREKKSVGINGRRWEQQPLV